MSNPTSPPVTTSLPPTNRLSPALTAPLPPRDVCSRCRSRLVFPWICCCPLAPAYRSAPGLTLNICDVWVEEGGPRVEAKRRGGDPLPRARCRAKFRERAGSGPAAGYAAHRRTLRRIPANESRPGLGVPAGAANDKQRAVFAALHGDHRSKDRFLIREDRLSTVGLGKSLICRAVALAAAAPEPAETQPRFGQSSAPATASAPRRRRLRGVDGRASRGPKILVGRPQPNPHVELVMKGSGVRVPASALGFSALAGRGGNAGGNASALGASQAPSAALCRRGRLYPSAEVQRGRTCVLRVALVGSGR
jgi:hypothetical protein